MDEIKDNAENIENELDITENVDTIDIINEIPKKKRNIKKIVIISVIFVLFITLSLLSFDILNDYYGFVKPYKEIEFTIAKGESAGEIIKDLQNNKVIKYSYIFGIYLKRHKKEDKFISGVYTINRDFSYEEIVKKLQTLPPKKTVNVTIPEGYTQTQIISAIAEKTLVDKEKLTEEINKNKLNYPFLANLPVRESRLEGYLFPDTYEFYVDDKAFAVLDKILKTFYKKINDNEIEQKAKNVDMTLDEAIILASIIERETLHKEDLPIVSSVYHNRIKKGMKLQACVTVLYALGEHKDFITIEDTKIESPYNTYFVDGLPKGPICNPGMDAILATVEPAKSDYFYYYSTPDGKIYFSKTYAQHLATIRKHKGGKGTDSAN